MTLGFRILSAQTVAVAALAALAACGGANPAGPSGGGGGGGGGSAVVGSTGSVGGIGATITIANNTVSPAQVTISVGQSVTFVNADGRAHEMASDPHPVHTNCPSISNVGLLQPGQSKSTFGFSNAGTCGFHDHNQSDTASMQGRIVVQ